MATLKGTNATLRANVPSEKVPPGEGYGRLHIMYDDYLTPGAAPSNGDLINFMKIPVNFRVMEAALAFPDMGTAGTVELGWAASDDGTTETADDNGFLASIDVNTAADVVLMSSYANLAGQCKKFSAEVQVQLTVTAAWTSTSARIRCWIIGMVD